MFTLTQSGLGKDAYCRVQCLPILAACRLLAGSWLVGSIFVHNALASAPRALPTALRQLGLQVGVQLQPMPAPSLSFFLSPSCCSCCSQEGYFSLVSMHKA